MPRSQQEIAIAATFAAEPIRLPISNWLDVLGMDHQVHFAPYNQVFQQLLDSTSLLSRNRVGLNVLCVRIEDWIHSPDEVSARLEEFSVAVRTFAAGRPVPLLICFCPHTPDLNLSFQQQLAQAAASAAAEFADLANVHVVLSDELTRLYPVAAYHDATTLQTAHIPYTPSLFVALATVVIRRLHALHRRPYKVVAMDCDNTLWQGVCGEDGPLGVQVSGGYVALQQRLLELRQGGLLLAICSKNNIQDVWDVFEKHPAMLLRREHITAAEINWQSKSSNLRTLAEQLKLDCDSFIFLDDSPLECAEVRSSLPQVLTLQLPAIEELAGFLDHVWVFDQPKTTSEDRQRADLYRDELLRQEQRISVPSLRDFLQSLELQVTFLDVSGAVLTRVAQLSQRTNQFNCTLKRYQAAELERFLAQAGCSAFAVDVSDKFGDYGVVGACTFQVAKGALILDNLLLSCRALGRGVERHLLKHIGEVALSQDAQRVEIDFVASERNAPARTFLNEIGHALRQPAASGTRYVFPVSQLLGLDPLAVQEHVLPATPDSRFSNNRSAAVAPSELISRIANGLRNVEQISDMIRSQARPRPEIDEPYVPALSELERRVAAICADVLHLQRVGMNDALHDLGGSSLQIVLIHSRLRAELNSTLSITELYTLPTIGAIVERIASSKLPRAKAMERQPHTSSSVSECGIAVIGMAGRFPGASCVDEFWRNLVQGVCSIMDIPEEQLNLPPDSPLRQHPNLVRKAASVSDADKFDARFFGIFPKEAMVMDPQHRLMLECCWHAIEDAGYNVDAINVPVGVFAGCYMDTYILSSLATNPTYLESLANSFHGGDLHTELGNDKDYLATRVSYLLNLRGPSLTVQTACSTSLVAVIQACQALLSRQCDMALAGGVTLKLPQNRGYLYTEGGMVSPDGVCRTFDAKAHGTVFGEGVGAVLLKRVADAVADGDDIYAVIRGWGINNDGRAKMGYTAPSVEGQRGAIEMAHRLADISAETITYVEAHGTGTSLGDPIEIDSLTRAFRRTTDKRQYCAIGSAKTNIGHLDVAAGVAGLIKTSLALKHHVIPASLNYEQPNPNINFEDSPFFVNTQLCHWDAPAPRRAGLSSFGVGGTNAHLVLEEPPERSIAVPSRKPQLLTLSARTPAALEKMTEDLLAHLRKKQAFDIADVAFTLQTGRKTFNYTRVVLARDAKQAIQAIDSGDPGRVFTHHQVRRKIPVVFMFPGQGSQHRNMAHDLYTSDREFQKHVNQCADLLEPHLGFDLRNKIFGPQHANSADELNQTASAQGSIFAVSYALAKRLETYGIVPQRMMGHSVGEFVAACLAGVFSLEDALRLVAFRACQMQKLPPGSMLAVRLSEVELRPRLTGGLTIAAINSPTLCVVSGPTKPVEDLRGVLEQEDIVCRPLHTSHAFHSVMMEPVVEPFADQLRRVQLHAPSIPIISSVTGLPLTEEQAVDAMYWARHLRETVRFTDALATLCEQPEAILLEVGPGQTLSTLARQHPSRAATQSVLSTLPHARQSVSPEEHWMLSLGRLWQSGVDVDWSLIHEERRLRVHLPGYSFERQRFWFESQTPQVDPKSQTATPDEKSADKHAPIPAPSPHDSVQMPLADEPQLSVQLTDQPSQQMTEETGNASSEAEAVTHRIIQQQLRLMKQQLEAWRN